jgi:MFS superfamily sulfate permease-like transporter
LALVLSLLQHLRHSYQPHTAVVLHDARDHWRFEAAEPGRMIEPGLVMFWFGSDLFYANASLFIEKVRHLVEESPSPVRWLVVDASAITDIDYSAGRAVLELQQALAKAGVVLGLARINRQDHGDFDRIGLAAAIGEDHIFASRRQCIAAYQAAFSER